MQSDRLDYRPLELADLDAFHALVQDPHVRRYLLDGNLHPREWTEERIRESQALFQQRAVGLWLARERATGALVGFCGFLRIPELGPEPQIVYALTEPFTARGYATEMGQATIAHARALAGFSEIVASVDEVNAASVRVLEKLGFQRQATVVGAFGSLLMLVLRDPRLTGSRNQH